MKIPKRFTLLGCPYVVRVVPVSEWSMDDCVGIFLPQSREIRLRQDKRQALEHAFLHELTHAVLLAMGREKLYGDEAFVDLLSGLFHQALTSGNTRG
jgi:hypothetical protein